MICKETHQSWPKAKAALKLQIIDREEKKLAAQEAEQAASVVEQTEQEQQQEQLDKVTAEVELLKEMLDDEDSFNDEAEASLQADIDRLRAKQLELVLQANQATAEALESIEQDSQELTQTISQIEAEGGGGYV